MPFIRNDLFTSAIRATALGSLCLLAACATDETAGSAPAHSAENIELSDAAKAELLARPGNACIRHARNVRSFNVIDNRTVFFEAGRRDYLATVRLGCFDLTIAPQLRLIGGPTGQICGGSLDKIDIGREVCTIDRIYEVDGPEEGRALHGLLKEAKEERRRR